MPQRCSRSPNRGRRCRYVSSRRPILLICTPSSRIHPQTGWPASDKLHRIFQCHRQAARNRRDCDRVGATVTLQCGSAPDDWPMMDASLYISMLTTHVTRYSPRSLAKSVSLGQLPIFSPTSRSAGLSSWLHSRDTAPCVERPTALSSAGSDASGVASFMKHFFAIMIYTVLLS